ncbi:uncharacterized protein BCR38DRAFT_426413 [Pseudomassariella vexata]|uniref:Uncharacterized protein n=1 Tax=Pseudomassariella vexata TaxID=1141098 RepID=A0A1Y2E8N7_9PEZI|nr:uncharacterized protein BCR38DRAFT_426413 [Pseudomassariella vexata]ORY67225.1 hypothetical protein BCR38DRAFT_426413 [Pseudomassariella vexata]
MISSNLSEDEFCFSGSSTTFYNSLLRSSSDGIYELNVSGLIFLYSDNFMARPGQSCSKLTQIFLGTYSFTPTLPPKPH